MLHILEHFCDTIKLMREIHRMSKPNATILIRVPHFSGSTAWTNPDHKKAFSIDTFKMFETDNFPPYSPLFKIKERKLNYGLSTNSKNYLNLKIFLDKIINFFLPDRKSVV